MTQKELDDLWNKFADEDDSYDDFGEKVEKLGGILVGEFDYCPDSDVGGTYGLEKLWKVLKKHRFTILENPTRDSLCDNGVVIFPPKKS
jgi:hypothetical protein